MKRKKEPVVEEDFLDLTRLIRSIQLAEGEQDCFRRGEGDCDRLDCVWRKYCLEERKEHPSR